MNINYFDCLATSPGHLSCDWLALRSVAIFMYTFNICDRAPRYLADHLIPASDAAPRRLRLRSANLNRFTVPRYRLSCRAFYRADPTVWNWLPDELRNPDSFDGFERFLRTIFSVTLLV